MLLSVSETWVSIAAMMQNIEGVHVGFLRKVTGENEQRLGDKTCRKEGAYRVLKAAGTKTLRGYIKKRQATVAERFDIRPIFKACAKETGYEVGEVSRDVVDTGGCVTTAEIHVRNILAEVW